MSKYIKKVNWPWVEIEDGFEGEHTVTINMDAVAIVWPRVNGHYHYGVKLKNGDWFEFISEDALKELQDLLMKETSEDSDLNSAANGLKWLNDLFTNNEESQSVLDWLKENGQA